MAGRNIALTFPEDLVRRLEVVAANQKTSMAALIIATLSQLVDRHEGYADARDALLADLTRGYELGTHGKISWSRESLHER